MLFQKILDDLKQKIVAQGAYKGVVCKTLSDLLHTTITPDMVVKFKEGVLTLKIPPTVKMALSLKKDVVLTELQKEGIDVRTII